MCSMNSNVFQKSQTYTKWGKSKKIIEAEPVLQSIPIVINGVRCGDTEAVAKALEDISQSIQDMTEALKLMQGSGSNIQS